MSKVTTTYLEMTDPGQLCPKTCDDPRFRIMEAPVKQWRLNRFLYELIGTDWLWTDKLPWNEEQWREYVEDENLTTYLAMYDGSIAGYFELSRQGDDMEIAYFGLAPEFIGRGLGGSLLTLAIQEAWARNPERVWVHTCSLDHEAALANYEARGLKIYKTETSALSQPSELTRTMRSS